jgi:hypothetical protein
MFQARQGDVFVEQVDYIPADAKPIDGPIILAHGEATGHAHTVSNRVAKYFSCGDDRYLLVEEPAIVEHQEHAPITLMPGTYRVRQQREYSPLETRNVAD